MNILNLLASNSFITVNKELIKAVGIEAAILFGELAGEYVYWVEQNQGESFFSTVENIEEKTTLNDYQQRKAIKVLKDKGLIECKVKGIPAKRYFEIHEDRLLELFKFKFSKNLRHSSEKFKELDVENFQSNKNIENKNIEKEYNNNNIGEKKFSPTPTKKKKFVKPSLDDVRAYCQERQNNVDAERFVDYYEANGWKVGKNPMKDWKAAVRTWEKNSYNKPIQQPAPNIADIPDEELSEMDRIYKKLRC